MNPESVINHTDRDHAEFSPSQLKYLATCAGYHGHDGSSAAADMGTRIHEALEVRDPSALQSEEEIEIYEQLLKDEEEVFDYVFGDLGGVEINREMRLHLDLDAVSPTFGTCDIVAIMPLTGVALVADYKTGVSRIDQPRENWQAKAYTLGVFQTFPKVDIVHFAFLVPRNGGVITGTFRREEMQTLKNEISDVVRSAEQTRPKWEEGTMDIDDLSPSHNCRFCRREDHCPALGAVSVEIARRVKPGILPDGIIRASEVENPEVMAKLYLVARIVEEWASAIKFKALSMVLAGTELPGLRLKSMGTPLVVEDNVNLANLAKRFGMTEEELIESATLSLNKLGEVLGGKAPRGQKAKTIEAFREEAVGLGVVAEGKTKYTLAQTKQDED
jgi:hypothetical protein